MASSRRKYRGASLLVFTLLLLCFVSHFPSHAPCGFVRAEDDDVEDYESSNDAADLEVEAQGGEENFDQDLKDAIESQEFREDVDKKVHSHIVDAAPEIELTNGDGDVSTTHNCSVDIDVFCTDVAPGEGRIAKCLSEQISEEKLGNSEGRSVSESCKYELKTYLYLRATNINLHVPYAKACKVDIDKHCEDITEDDGEDATILIQNCLRRKKYQISTGCRKQLTSVLLEQAKDYKMNMELFYSCNDDAERHCKGVTGDGAVQDCLLRKRRKLEWECEEALLKNIADNADDLRLLSYKIYKTCLPDKKKFCKEIELGNARTQACLESKIYEPGFSLSCRKELLFLQEQRTMQWQWDEELKSGCKQEIPELCGYSDDEFGDFGGDGDEDDSISLDDSTVLNCLVDYREEITSSSCKAQVDKKIVSGSKNIRLNRRAFEACFEDQDKFCRKIQPGEGEVYQCLRKHAKDVSDACKRELFEEAKLESENVDRNPQIMKKCKSLIKAKCKDVVKGEGRVLDCLTKPGVMNAPESRQPCRQVLHDYLVTHMKDYRLDYGLNHACKTEVGKFCGPDDVSCEADSEEACQGEVYNCLIGNVTRLGVACKTQVKEAISLHALNVRYDPQLFNDCRDDITSLCLVEFGRNEPYGVHDCLFRQVDKLSKRCKRQEFKLEAVKVRDVTLMPHIQKDCPSELVSYCKDVPHGNGQKWSCLSHYAMVKPYSPDCLRSMYLHTKRIAQSKGLEPDVLSGCKHEVKACKRAGFGGGGEKSMLKCLSTGATKGEIGGGSDAKGAKGAKVTKVSALCQKAVAKYTRQAFYFYFGKDELLATCDADVGKLCGSYAATEVDEGFEYTPGSILRCLAESGSDLAEQCAEVVQLGLKGDTVNDKAAAPIIMDREGNSGGSSGSSGGAGAGTTKQSSQQQRGGGGPSVQQSGIVISGGLAVLCIGSFVLVILGVAFFIYRQYYQPAGLRNRNPYTLVTKSGDV